MAARLADRPSVIETLPGWAHSIFVAYIVGVLTLIAGCLA